MIRSIPPYQPPTVLVVEDDQSVLSMLAAALPHFGFSVLAAPDGRAAVRLLRDHHRDVDAALVDYRMPGMDGLATIHALREVCPHLPCCLRSGSLDDQAARLAEVEVIVQAGKPFSPAAVAAQLRAILPPDATQGPADGGRHHIDLAAIGQLAGEGPHATPPPG